MQFYLNGFQPGDPAVTPADLRERRPSEGSPEQVDTLIVGAGPAGLVLAAQLAQFPEIRTRIIEKRGGPLQLGQADGIACRTVEMFHAFGLSEQLLRESYWVNETTFWRPADSDRDQIVRVGRVRDTEDGVSEFPHVIVNQARIHEFLLSAMRNSPTRLEPEYGTEFVGVTVHHDREYPIEARVRDETGATRVIHAKYLVGCDGARSGVRRAIGRELRGDAANHAWGVMDILAVTDFPDIRLKSAIQSAEAGSILLIPREGGYMVRLYVDLGQITEENRRSVRELSPAEVVEVANRVLSPYRLDVAETVWFSIYEVAQRLTDAFDDAEGRGTDPRVFIAGDACHTHSAKAGQGMNVSMQDAFNLGWKLAAVLRGQSAPSLLQTYTQERHPIAQELIDFDREWSALVAAAPSTSSGAERETRGRADVQDYFVRQGRYTAGVATKYPESILIGPAVGANAARGFEVGTRFHSAPVTRVADARTVQLGHLAQADGRWRVYAFSGEDEEPLRDLSDWLSSAPESPLIRHTPQGDDLDSVIDVRVILQRAHHAVDLGSSPEIWRPRKGRFGLVDYEKVFSAPVREAADIYVQRGIDRSAGCVVVVRPDQYISSVLALDDRTALTDFFARVLVDADHRAGREVKGDRVVGVEPAIL